MYKMFNLITTYFMKYLLIHKKNWVIVANHMSKLFSHVLMQYHITFLMLFFNNLFNKFLGWIYTVYNIYILNIYLIFLLYFDTMMNRKCTK